MHASKLLWRRRAFQQNSVNNVFAILLCNLEQAINKNNVSRLAYILLSWAGVNITKRQTVCTFIAVLIVY